MGPSGRWGRFIAITALALVAVAAAVLFVLHPAPPWPYLAANAALGVVVGILTRALPPGNRRAFVTTFLIVAGLSIIRTTLYRPARDVQAPAFWQGLGVLVLGMVAGDLAYSRRRAQSAPEPSETTSSAPPA
jgi:peptidoglycan/LPS O-acetylase OafA/YrhL